jgi:hypothetical protein
MSSIQTSSHSLQQTQLKSILALELLKERIGCFQVSDLWEKGNTNYVGENTINNYETPTEPYKNP